MIKEMFYTINLSEKKIIVDNITGDVLRPLFWLVIEQNGCKHRILSYVKYRHRWKKFKGSKLSNRNPSQLIYGKPWDIKLLGPIPKKILYEAMLCTPQHHFLSQSWHFNTLKFLMTLLNMDESWTILGSSGFY